MVGHGDIDPALSRRMLVIPRGWQRRWAAAIDRGLRQPINATCDVHDRTRRNTTPRSESPRPPSAPPNSPLAPWTRANTTSSPDRQLAAFGGLCAAK